VLVESVCRLNTRESVDSRLLQWLARTPKSGCSRESEREMSKERLMHGKEHQVSTPNESLMTAASAGAVSMER
jgi:hypothetical protein